MSIYDEDQYRQMHLDCYNRIGQCSDWERSFLSTCCTMIDKRIPLSDKQRVILNDLWERVTANG